VGSLGKRGKLVFPQKAKKFWQQEAQFAPPLLPELFILQGFFDRKI